MWHVGDLAELIRQFGSPATVEIKTEEGESGVQNSGVRPESYAVSETPKS